MSDTSWTGRKQRKRSRRKNEVPPQSSEHVSSDQRKGPMTRSRVCEPTTVILCVYRILTLILVCVYVRAYSVERPSAERGEL